MWKVGLLLICATTASAIIKGTPTLAFEEPWQVAIQLHFEHGAEFCGGSLLTTRFVLSAANCMRQAKETTALLGAGNITNVQQILPINKVTVHPKFGSWSYKYDVALCRLSREARLGEYVQTIRLPSWAQKKKTFKNAVAIVAGWGRDGVSKIVPTARLNKVEVKVITNFDCWWSYPLYLGDTNLCTSSKKGMPCDGDEGNALWFKDEDGKPTLIGIASYEFSLGCSSWYPAVYARVTEFLQWIQDTSDNEIIIRDK